MPICSYCGKDVAPDSDACPGCGGKDKLYEPTDITNEATGEAPAGIGGWLILVAIGVIISPFKMAFELFGYSELFENGTWGLLTTPGTETFIPSFSVLMFVEMAVAVVFIIGYLYLAYLLIRKSRKFPRFFIGIMVCALAWLIGDALLVKLVIPDQPIFDSDTIKDIRRQ